MLTCGNGVSRTRPGEHRRRTNLRNCQDPLVLVSCGVWRVRRCVSAAVLLCLRARCFCSDVVSSDVVPLFSTLEIVVLQFQCKKYTAPRCSHT